MKTINLASISLVIALISLWSCQKNGNNTGPYAAIKAKFGTKIDPTNLANYANQTKPTYIIKDNTAGNTISNPKATLGRVLFYDKQLSINNTISCGSCHIQKFAFGDTAVAVWGY